jgi:diguanylate cyclase
MIDIDHFKQFNDNYGHLVGDECLKLVAQTIGTAVKRSPDSVARYGGEEFAVILGNTPLEGATHVGETIRIAIENSRFMVESREVSLTVSIGVATASPSRENSNTPEISIKNLIGEADQYLYQAKSEGRNKVAFPKSLPF